MKPHSWFLSETTEVRIYNRPHTVVFTLVLVASVVDAGQVHERSKNIANYREMRVFTFPSVRAMSRSDASKFA
jgi:hypothetical protein